MDVGSDVLQLRDQVRGLRAEVSELQFRLNSALVQADRTEGEKALIDGQLADALARLEAAEAEVVRLARVEAHLALTKDGVAAMYASQTWRIGRLFVGPIARLRGAFRPRG